MKVLFKYNDQEQNFEFNTFTFRMINGVSDDLNSKDFSLQIINTSDIEADFSEVVILYNLYDFCEANIAAIDDLIIYSKTNKLLFSTKQLKMKIKNIVFRNSSPFDKIQSFVDITLEKGEN